MIQVILFLYANASVLGSIIALLERCLRELKILLYMYYQLISKWNLLLAHLSKIPFQVHVQQLFRYKFNNQLCQLNMLKKFFMLLKYVIENQSDHLSSDTRKPVFDFRPGTTIQAVKPQEMASYHEADLRLCFRICKRLVF